jgi:CDP-diacylglycerol--inositol 3-phosphatidyltransferase
MAATKSTAATPAVTTEDVLVYIPNLIGYARIACCLSSFVLMLTVPDFWVCSILLYLAGFVGDLIDGWAARRFNQMSSYGGVLDMVTDRCSTLGLLYVLGGESAYNGVSLWRLTFLMLQILDVSSHWTQMHSSLSLNAHHKSVEGNAGKNFLVRWFYQYYWFFGYLCVGAEFTYALLYVKSRLLASDKPSPLLDLVNYSLMVTSPGCVAKQTVNIMQLCSSCYAIAKSDADKRNSKHQ